MFAAAMVLVGAPANAHKPSDSYLTLTQGDAGQWVGRWDIALRDLEHAIGLDRDGNGEITWGELRGQHAAIRRYAFEALALRSDGKSCPLLATGQRVDHHSDGAYTVLDFTAQCEASAQLEVEYQLFFDLDPSHRGLLRLQGPEGEVTTLFSPERPYAKFELARLDRRSSVAAYGREGVGHVWGGLDHVLFLLMLLLPAVLVRRDGEWQPVVHFRAAAWDAVGVVTAFTLSHSLTLALAALGILALPAQLTESAIAASVFLAALHNLRPIWKHGPALMALVLGLIHGLGFASGLLDLGLSTDSLALPLVAFNMGVEVGQLAIVSVFLPLAFLLRSGALYRVFILRGASVAVALLALRWFLERASVFDSP